MTYLRLLRLAARVLGWAMKRCDSGSRMWAELADVDGRIAFRQIDYVERVCKASGWKPVDVTVGDRLPPTWTITTPLCPTFTTTTGTNTTVTYKPSV